MILLSGQEINSQSKLTWSSATHSENALMGMNGNLEPVVLV